MGIATKISVSNLLLRLRASFITRDVILHDGRNLRRMTIAGRDQAKLAGIAAVTLCFSGYGVAHLVATGVEISGLGQTSTSPDTQLAQLRTKLSAMEANVATMKHSAKVHVLRIEERQALIAAVISGKSVAQFSLRAPALDARTETLATDVVAPFRQFEKRQLSLATQAHLLVTQRYVAAANQVRRLGIAPERLIGRMAAMGGPYEPVISSETPADANADAQFKSLFATWKKLDSLERAAISIPSAQPVTNVVYTSGFGIRSDPFRGTPAMHSGVDMPGAYGSPIFATADGIVSRAERSGGYGNMVEVNHGRGISTRYGHLSKILVPANSRVTRGQLIALMGSTGRSTGNHLHYEVRIDGQAVNPMPFLQTADLLLASRDRTDRGAAPLAGSMSAAD